jgi:flagellar biosynthesis regulator FlaF
MMTSKAITQRKKKSRRFLSHSILVLQAGEEEKDDLKIQIETAIAALNDPQSPMSI